jgi:hypothetical protein
LQHEDIGRDHCDPRPPSSSCLGPERHAKAPQ